MDAKVQEALGRLEAGAKFWAPQLQKDLATVRTALAAPSGGLGITSAELKRLRQISESIDGAAGSLLLMVGGFEGGAAAPPRPKRTRTPSAPTAHASGRVTGQGAP